jgi:hypothetical protein
MTSESDMGEMQSRLKSVSPKLEGWLKSEAVGMAERFLGTALVAWSCRLLPGPPRVQAPMGEDVDCRIAAEDSDNDLRSR